MVVTFPLLPPEERYKELVGLVGNGLGALPPYCQVEAWARTPQSLGDGRDEKGTTTWATPCTDKLKSHGQTLTEITDCIFFLKKYTDFRNAFAFRIRLFVMFCACSAHNYT